MNRKYKDDIITIGASSALIFIILQIVFYKENPLVVFRTALGMIWLFYLPGYAVMNIWKENFDAVERSVIAIAVGISLVSIISYFLTLIGVPIRIQWLLAPSILIFSGISIHIIMLRRLLR